MSGRSQTLADRLGKTLHVSPLRYKIVRLMTRFPCPSACIEDWLVAVANARGARVVMAASGPDHAFVDPPPSAFSPEELVVAICQVNCLDRPQMLRLAAQLISRGVVDPSRLRLAAERERAQPVLAELSRQALKVAPDHRTWLQINLMFGKELPLREPILHWTRLAEPIMKDGKCHAGAWRLVA
jgi:hypothetical protein